MSQWDGRQFTPGCDSDKKHRTFSPYDYFMAMFPQEQLKAMVEFTSISLRKDDKKPTCHGEMLKWLGITLLFTQVEFGDRSSCWENDVVNKRCKYLFCPQFGWTGMSRDRYEEINKHIVWSFQPDEREPGMSAERYRWMLVQDFVDRFNGHRKDYFTPATLIVVDESMSRWYGMGGHWINEGLPMYIAMDRKPDDSCEIQNAACSLSGIMLRLKLVKSAAAEAEANEDDLSKEDDNG